MQNPLSFLLLFWFTFTGSLAGHWKSYCTITMSWILSRVVDWSTWFLCTFSSGWILFQMISGLGRFWFLFNTWRLWWFLIFRYWTSRFATSCRACSSTARVWASGCCRLTRSGQWNSRRFLIQRFNRSGLFEFFRFRVMHKRYPPGNLSNFKGKRTYKKKIEQFYQGKMSWYLNEWWIYSHNKDHASRLWCGVNKHQEGFGLELRCMKYQYCLFVFQRIYTRKLTVYISILQLTNKMLRLLRIKNVSC